MQENRWISVEPVVEPGKHKYLIATCSCGKTKRIRKDHYLSGKSKSCGCLRVDVSRENSTKHGENDSDLHKTWVSMRNRTRCETSTSYKHYGGRGIDICAKWEEFLNFKEWALEHGYRKGLEIDRIDNDEGYYPENCRWVGRSENMRNTRSTKSVLAFGEQKSLADWIEDERCGAKYPTVWARLNKGWEPERAITKQ